MKSRYFFNGRSCLGLGVVWWRRGAGQERSHAAWRSFFSKTMLPMQRGARSGPRGCRQERSHAAWRSFFAKAMLPMQRGARCGQRRHTNNQTNHQTDMLAPIVNVQMHLAIYKHICHWIQHVLQCFRTCWLPIIHCC